ncbi:MAG: bifunctional glutamate N-acetyltransferase/amino-acid acetyltransferase ArgJ [Geodermatophilaceae bacterium]|nr:bifunctional glutamate N-acetyltransferase/amino-acid acetyltransferase ArgJ [Geodermatophilaceae bacterium]
MTVTAAQGFRAAGISAGLKSAGLDLAVLVNDGPLDTAAGVFTANRVTAAPVRWSRQVLSTGRVRAVVLNSGGANACTGPAGFQDTHSTAERAATALGVGAVDVAVCSTGLIGVRLDMDALLPGVDKAVAALHRGGGAEAAQAILTTDSVAKESSYAGPGWTVGGMAKGAGMLAPALATMLAVVTTDAVVDPATADASLRAAAAQTFDRVDSDGCMSTNDTVLFLASGASGLRPDPQELTAALTAVCADLVAQLLADAEGSTKDIEVAVHGASTVDDALEVARSIARSNLLKCALHGEDPNWGRVLAAIGTTRAAFDPDQLDVAMNGIVICSHGAAAADRSTVDLSGRRIVIAVDLNAGTESATVWTNDLSVDYVRENSAYAS